MSTPTNQEQEVTERILKGKHAEGCFNAGGPLAGTDVPSGIDPSLAVDGVIPIGG